MKKFLSLVILLVLFAMFAGIANAFVIYDNMEGNVYDGTSYDLITGSGAFIGSNYVAEPFIAWDGDYTLCSIEIPVSIDAGTSSLIVALLADDSGTPGSLIESIGPTTIGSGIVQFNSVTHPVLYDYTQYWVAVYPGGSDTWASWYLTTNSVGSLAYNENDEGWTVDESSLPAMRVNGCDPVPEPSSILMLLSGAGALGGIIIRRRK